MSVLCAGAQVRSPCLKFPRGRSHDASPMQTLRLRAIQRPSRTDELLRALARKLPNLHACARPIEERSQLPSQLQRLATEATKSGRSWSAWTDGYRLWFFTAEISLALSRERGCTVLQLDAYGEKGELQDSGYWVLGRDGAWRRCVV